MGAEHPSASPRRHTPIVLAEAIVQLLEEAQASSFDANAALAIAKEVIRTDRAFSVRGDAAFEAYRAARDAALDGATSDESRPPLSQSL